MPVNIDMTPQLIAAYDFCQQMASDHYENFPVASYLLPRALRRPIASIYAFARTADDFADEGDLSPQARLTALEGYEQKLNEIAVSKPQADPIFMALQKSIEDYDLDLQALRNLLKAFKQDVVKTSYNTVEELLEYCQYSANPIGRLLLQLSRQASAINVSLSDKLCTCLQLINFWQDLKSDLDQRQRLYLPLNELEAAGLPTEPKSLGLVQGAQLHSLNLLVQQNLLFCKTLLEDARPLRKLKGRMGLELRMVHAAAEHMLSLLQARPSPFIRPKLKLTHLPRILWRAWA